MGKDSRNNHKALIAWVNILYKFLVNCRTIVGRDMEGSMSGDMGLDETIIFLRR